MKITPNYKLRPFNINSKVNNQALQTNPTFGMKQYIAPKIAILSGAAASALAAEVLAQCATTKATSTTSPNGTIIMPKEFPPNDDGGPDLFDIYDQDNYYPYFDSGEGKLTKEANALTLPINNSLAEEEVIFVSNADEPMGTIAGTATLDKTLYTEFLLVCAALAVVDKTNNTQTLIHVYPGFSDETNKQIIGHILSASKPENLEISIVPGCYPGTRVTLQFILDALNELVPNVSPKLYSFSDEIEYEKGGLFLHNGELSSCDKDKVKNKKINPNENITYSKYQTIEYVGAKDVEEMLMTMEFPTEYDLAAFKRWAYDNKLGMCLCNNKRTADFLDKDNNIVRSIDADLDNSSNAIAREYRCFYDDNGCEIADIIKRKNEPIICKYNQRLQKSAILIDGIWYDKFSREKLPKHPITNKPQ